MPYELREVLYPSVPIRRRISKFKLSSVVSAPSDFTNRAHLLKKANTVRESGTVIACVLSEINLLGMGPCKKLFLLSVMKRS